ESDLFRLSENPADEVVRSIILLCLAGPAVAGDDGRPVNRHRHPFASRRLHLDFGKVLRLFVPVIEALADAQILFAEDAGMATADVTGADVLKALQPGAAARKAEHVVRAVHVDAHSQ